ncbi:N-acetylmuramoyl-L-alanine amidase [Palleronia sp. LCG004]|uniref:N-acetylmuramoyl-L-alanine amidase n=1 Tax=Palleronia sp. LCG004 TaxID=3079304 RepID=UPI002943BE6D|nr:AMIN domain-containing protein [Palleronia sp. LCG004]WOI55169.1 AMIN domain-containing protein [Palleronia sp. LCG004]
MVFKTSIGRAVGACLFPALLILGPAAVAANEPGAAPLAIAQIDPAGSRIEDFGSDLQIELALSQAVPWRVFTLDDPHRLVADFAELDFSEVDLAALVDADLVEGVTYGRYRAGWSRMVLVLAQPMRVETAGLSAVAQPGAAVLKMSLAPTSDRDFEAVSGAPESDLFVLPGSDAPELPPASRDGRLQVVIDTGRAEPSSESAPRSQDMSALLAGVARTLAHALGRDGHEVHLLGPGDDPGPRAANADLVLSLRADAAPDDAPWRIAPPAARLQDAEAASDDPARNDSDLLEAAPRGERLAAWIVDGLARHTDDLHRRPRLSAGFSVPEAASLPAIHVSLDFASVAEDRADLADPAWRARAVAGLREAIASWAEEDAAAGAVVRQ